MKKRRKYNMICMIIVALIIIGLIPLKFNYYKDGGTVEVFTLLFRYKHWHFMDDELYCDYKNDPQYSSFFHENNADEIENTGIEGYWERIDFYIFPFNFSSPQFFED